MQFTAQQAATIKAYVLGTPDLASKTSGPGTDYGYIANALNAAFSPTFYVYRTDVPMSEVMLNGFDWARVDNLSVGKARIWEWLGSSNLQGTIDPSKPNIRAGINAVWVGTAADLAVRSAVYLHCQRAATVAEKLLVASGAGTACNASGDGPGVMGWTGSVSLNDVSEMFQA